MPSRWPPSPLVPLTAFALSVLLHLLLLTRDELFGLLPSSLDDEVLQRKPVEDVPPVRLRLVPGQARVATPPAPARHPRPATPPAPVPEPLPIEPTPPETLADEPIVPGEAVPAAPVVEPPPAFPIQVRAVLDTRYNGLPFTITQYWGMEGYRYAIHQEARRFGFRIRISSEGEIDPATGLKPEQYRVSLNDKTRAACDRDGTTLEYGPLDQRRQATLTEIPQDMASLPFHVAVTFSGQPLTHAVCTGQNLYRIRLAADAEEWIKLPAGTLRTLHLTGERFDPATGQLIRGYEVWLALDYLHYPVKFIGRTGNGDTLEYRVKALELEGRWVLGEAPANAPQQPAEDDIPPWLRERLQQRWQDEARENPPTAPDLNNP